MKVTIFHSNTHTIQSVDATKQQYLHNKNEKWMEMFCQTNQQITKFFSLLSQLHIYLFFSDFFLCMNINLLTLAVEIIIILQKILLHIIFCSVLECHYYWVLLLYSTQIYITITITKVFPFKALKYNNFYILQSNMCVYVVYITKNKS